MSITIAQIGCGYWGPNLLRAFLQNSKCRVQHVVEISPDRVSWLQSQYPSLSILSDINLVWEDPQVQAVAIATPAHTHYSLVKRALQNGKNVFVEKPLATSLKEALELAKLAEEKEKLLMVGHTFLYNEAVYLLKEHLDISPNKPYYFYGQRLNLGIIRSDINVWWNLAPHDISILLYLMEEKFPSSISIQGHSYLQPNIEDVAFATLHWEDKVAAHLHLSWLDPNKVRRLTAVGSQKMIVYDDLAAEKIAVYDRAISPTEKRKDYDQKRAPFSPYQFGDVHFTRLKMLEPLQKEVNHFCDCILEKIPCLTGAKHACKVVALLEAGQQSLQKGGKEISLSSLKTQLEEMNDSPIFT